jgi:prepilin-type N-terminal cleavage/methylation domain-containing protein/prepilin-type processing-associated H-X9-DG protein
MKTKRAFTLIELLVVLVIIAILALLVSVAANSFQKKAAAAQSIANLRQLSAGLLNYIGAHDGELPRLGVPEPAWGAPDDKEREAWYYAVPKAAGGRGLNEFDRPDSFYEKKNVLYLPVAKYPDGKRGRPYFALAMNGSLFGDAEARQNSDNLPNIRISNLQLPTSTIVFLETGLPDEEPLPGQAAGNYRGSAHGGPENVVARYNQSDSKQPADTKREARINFVFGDGHVESLAAKDVIDQAGKAYKPQLHQFGGEGKVLWTVDPDGKP